LLTRGVAAKGSTPPKGLFDVLVATPLRLVGMIRDGSVDLAHVRTLVFDEADRLFDEQFVEQIDEIAAAVKSATAAAAAAASLRVSLFSATMMPRVEQLAASLMRDPVHILVGLRNVPLASIKQSLVFTGNEEGKLITLRRMITTEGIRLPALVFVQSKERAQDLLQQLLGSGIPVDVIHADRPIDQRARIVDAFRAGKIWLLIATDVMARGMDFRGVECVINYDFPQSVVSYIHRIGRTGRAGAEGLAITFFTEGDAGMLRTIANSIKAAGCDVPDWMLQLKPLNRKKRQYIAGHAPRRVKIGRAPLPFKSERLSERERKLLVAKRPVPAKTPTKPKQKSRKLGPKPTKIMKK
jgi:ATP-dependent RNA helicase DDX52/ROK1